MRLCFPPRIWSASIHMPIYKSEKLLSAFVHVFVLVHLSACLSVCVFVDVSFQDEVLAAGHAAAWVRCAEVSHWLSHGDIALYRVQTSQYSPLRAFTHTHTHSLRVFTSIERQMCVCKSRSFWEWAVSLQSAHWLVFDLLAKRELICPQLVFSFEGWSSISARCC